MSTIYFTADLHLGHRAIAKYREGVSSMEDNTRMIVMDWEHAVTKPKRDIVFCLGDMAFDREHLDIIDNLPGRKILWRGNHEDKLAMSALCDVYEHVHGITRWKEFWVSHAPMHPNELYFKRNIHGHVHEKTITLTKPRSGETCRAVDPQYINVSADALMANFGKCIISLGELHQYIKMHDKGAVKLLNHKKYEWTTKSKSGLAETTSGAE